MSYIDKLLQGVEVEWKTIDELFHVKNGYTPSKKNKEFWLDGTVPWFRMEDLRTNGRVLSDSIQHVSESAIKGGKYFPANSIIIATSATIGEHALITVPYLSNQRFTNLSLKKEYKEVLMPKFLYYYCFILDEWCKNNTTVGNFAGVDMHGFKKFPIPIPPLEVQKEIIRILDTFTKLTAELTAELTARKKQYSYYRDKLLSFEENKVEWKTLGEVVQRTKNIKWNGTDEYYHYIDLSSVSRINNSITETIEITRNNAPSRAKKLVQKDDVIFATTRPTQMRYCLIPKEYSGDVASTGYCVLRAKSTEVLPKWIFYWVSSSEFKIYLEENQSGSAYPAISDAKVKDFKIPIPPLKEQEYIISILNKFDTLTSSISEGLPKEIELRKKQYEYYRDKLLTFSQK
ncbi:restriction endonuclease subunit S [Marinifilum sp. D714]|uniref:restriction endonuclease subunit S n=1 Tax=Marinifilum sp. D714 TaxID=2937523 RepID=UPI0027C43ED9|nr:restriction endonuclease subunit S [Marinifilum sp. D714]MDQ2178808.1 restriction endonuclease subunit S [Marinifilum sp. D714]